MSDESFRRIFNRARMDDRQVNELIGLAQGLIADDVINQAEVEFLQKWLAANTAAGDNPIVANLLARVNAILSGGKLDAEEAQELLETLRAFSGGDYEVGELLKSTTLPFDRPPPEISFSKTRFCFTGTFAFGSRTDCDKAVESRGAITGSLTFKTNYLVVGIYATDDWAHSCYGRKIEKAVEMKKNRVPIAIVGEQHWVNCLRV